MDILSLNLTEMKALMEELKEKPFRAKQVYSWLHEKKAASYEEMTNLSKDLREKLKENYPIVVPKIERMQESQLDGTRKYLFALSDGNLIESVLMRYHYGNSVCISSQVGCRMGCKFCASTVDGRVRDLTAGEMLSQIYAISRDIHEPVSHVVIMGSGEPMDNYDEVVRFIRQLCDENGNHMSMRNVTVSTCGLVERIYDFAKEDLSVTLALSLHAPNDEIRKTLMPIANKYRLEDVIAACDAYFEATGRRMTYEYALVRGVNDSPDNARELSRLLHGRNAHVNLIPVNRIDERDFEKPDSLSLQAFHKILEKNGINATIRREMGSDIDGACGQLRRRTMQEIQEGAEHQ